MTVARESVQHLMTEPIMFQDKLTTKDINRPVAIDDAGIYLLASKDGELELLPFYMVDEFYIYPETRTWRILTTCLGLLLCFPLTFAIVMAVVNGPPKIEEPVPVVFLALMTIASLIGMVTLPIRFFTPLDIYFAYRRLDKRWRNTIRFKRKFWNNNSESIVRFLSDAGAKVKSRIIAEE